MDWGMLTLYITTFALRYSTDFNVEFAQEYFEEEDSWKVREREKRNGFYCIFRHERLVQYDLKWWKNREKSMFDEWRITGESWWIALEIELLHDILTFSNSTWQCLKYALRQPPPDRVRSDIYCDPLITNKNDSLIVPMKHFYWLVADRHLWDGLDPIVLSEGERVV